MHELFFTVVLYGITLVTKDPIPFPTAELCETASRQLSGSNWVGACHGVDAFETTNWGVIIDDKQPCMSVNGCRLGK